MAVFLQPLLSEEQCLTAGVVANSWTDTTDVAQRACSKGFQKCCFAV